MELYIELNGNTATVIGYTGSNPEVNIPRTIPSNGIEYLVVSIGSYAFFKSTVLTSITIPNSVTSIGNDAFNHCSIFVFSYHRRWR